MRLLFGDVAAMFGDCLVVFDFRAKRISEVTEAGLNSVVVACWDGCVVFIVQL